MKKNIFVLTAVLLLATVAACLSESENPVVPTSITSGELMVDTGFTIGAEFPSYPVFYLGEHSAFTLRWNEVEEAVQTEDHENQTQHHTCTNYGELHLTLL